MLLLIVTALAGVAFGYGLRGHAQPNMFGLDNEALQSLAPIVVMAAFGLAALAILLRAAEMGGPQAAESGPAANEAPTPEPPARARRTDLRDAPLDPAEYFAAAIPPPGRTEDIADELRSPVGRTIWDTLGEVNEDVLAAYLRLEYPQTAAVILGKIRPDHAARVLARLPEDFAMEAVVRMLRMETIQKDILEQVEQTLRNEFMSNLARTARRDAHEMMAEIFNHFDRSTEERFMMALEDRAIDAAERIRTLMFTFEDLANLDPAGIQTLLRNVDKGRLSAALKGASEALREFFFLNMSERAAHILRDDMDLMGPIRVREADEAQQAIVRIAQQLADSGEITLVDTRDASEELVF